jgi:hypothetical protein
MVTTGKIPMRAVVDYRMTGGGLRLTLACRHEVVIPRNDATAMRVNFRLIRGEVDLVLPCAACYAAKNLDPLG